MNAPAKPTFAVQARAFTELRVRRGWTQEELARQIGSVQEVVARAESGRHPVNMRFLQRVADATKTTLVIGFDDPDPVSAAGLPDYLHPDFKPQTEGHR